MTLLRTWIQLGCAGRASAGAFASFSARARATAVGDAAHQGIPLAPRYYISFCFGLQYPRLQFLLIYFLTHQETLELPVGYEVAVVTGSNTAAFEMAMWNLLGERDVHCVHFEAFGKNWYVDAAEQLKLSVTQHTCAYGQLPDLSRVNFDADVMMTWNGTTSGVCMPDDVSVIPFSRKGLTFVDATSAVFAMPMPWAACDVTTFSWQKALGGEGAHGVIVMSPRAMQRLREYTPPWPVPKLFRMKSGGKVEDALFKGSVLNTVARSAPLMCSKMHLFYISTFISLFPVCHCNV